MKKIFFILTLLLLQTTFWASEMNAQSGNKRYYITKKGSPQTNGPRMGPSHPTFYAELNEVTGILNVTVFTEINSFQILIVRSGSILENDTFETQAGQIVTYNINGYPCGQYLLAVLIGGGITAEYIITIVEE